MITTDISVLVPAKTAAPTPQRMATRGTVKIPPASITDDTVTVTLPSYSADYGWPCRWIRQGNTLPAINAECLVLWDEMGAGTVVQWAGAGVALSAVGTITSGGSVGRGSGFSVARSGAGNYTVTFNPALPSAPVVVVGVGATVGGFDVKRSDTPTASGFSVTTFNTTNGVPTDSEWDFTATAV